jgi:hypothetical protein
MRRTADVDPISVRIGLRQNCRAALYGPRQEADERLHGLTAPVILVNSPSVKGKNTRCDFKKMSSFYILSGRRELRRRSCPVDWPETSNPLESLTLRGREGLAETAGAAT